MGINSGGLMGQIVAGYIAQKVNWHAGFATAGIGMVVGLTQYWYGRERLQQGLNRLAQDKAERRNTATSATTSDAWLTRDEWTRILAIVIFFIFASLFWGAYEQAGSTLNLFADLHTRLSVLGWEFPSSWLQAVQSACVILFAPIMAWLWMRLGRFEPSSPAKFALGLLFVGLAFVLLVPAGTIAETGMKVSPLWLIVAYAIMEIGELCLSPVGLSVVTKLSPARLVGVMMGVFFLSNALGNKIAGFAAGFVGSMPLPSLFGTVAAVTLAAAAVLAVMVPGVRRLMAGVR
jgi:POT family proton-dependent oligopeptide transporter